MKRMLVTLAAASAVLLTGCGSGGSPLQQGGSTGGAAGGDIIVGSSDVTENQVLAQIYAGALTHAGAKVTVKPATGAREIVVKALQDKSLSVVADYSGNLLRYFDKNSTATASGEVYTALKEKTPSGLEVLDQSKAEDKDVLVVTKATADSGITSMTELGPKCSQFVLGAAGEWKQRWVDKIKQMYGCTFKDIQTTDAGGPVTVNALKSGKAQVANLFTTSSEIQANGFVELADPKQMYPAQNIVPLIRTDALNDEEKKALNKVSAVLTTDDLTMLVKRVEVDKENNADVAATWLKDHGMA